MFRLSDEKRNNNVSTSWIWRTCKILFSSAIACLSVGLEGVCLSKLLSSLSNELRRGCGLPRSACCGYPGYSLDIVDILDIYASHKPNSDIELAELWWCFYDKLLNGRKCNYILVGPAAAARPCLLCHKIFLLCHKIIFATKSIYRTPRDKLSKNLKCIENCFLKVICHYKFPSCQFHIYCL